jgi:large subunit ribosomal protein L17
MKHRVFGNQLSRPTNQAKALYRSLVCEVLKYGRIETTLPKAKAVTGLIDRIINFGKRADISARRQIVSTLGTDELTGKLFSEIAPSLKDRSSGYTRIIKLGRRQGDGAETVYLELVTRAAASLAPALTTESEPAPEPAAKVIKPAAKPKRPVRKTAKKAVASKRVTKKS